MISTRLNGPAIISGTTGRRRRQSRLAQATSISVTETPRDQAPPSTRKPEFETPDSASTTTSTAYPPTASRSRDRIGGDAGAGSGEGGAAAMLREYGGSGRRAEGAGPVPPKGGGPGARPDGSMDPMDLLPDAAGPLGLILLALVDSTSMGTLVIPVILLVVGQGGALRVAGRTLVYLAVIGVFYLLLGIALLAGLLPLLDSFGHLLAAPQVMLVLAVIGVLLVIWSFRLDPKSIAKRGGDPEASARRWTGRARRASGRPVVLIVLALTAGLIEAASMIPYLAAMGILADMEVGLGRGALLLVGYCAVMVLPGAVLCGVRALLGERADTALDRVHDWAVKNATSAFSWAVGIVGAIIALNTAGPALAWLTGGAVS